MTDATGYTVELGGQVFTKEQWEAIQVYKHGTASPTVEIVGPDAPPKAWSGPVGSSFTATEPDRILHWDKGDKPFEFHNSEPGTEIGLKEAVFQALGYASGCWDQLSGAGVFHSTSAASVGEMVMQVINRYVDSAYKAGEAMHRTTVVNVVQPTMDDAKARTLLHQYSEWMDASGGLNVLPEDTRTHDDLVAEFLEQRDKRALPVVE